MIFFNFQSAHEAPLIKLFHLSNLLQTLNDRRMVDADSSAASPVVVRGSFSMMAVTCCQLRWLATRLLILKALVSLAKLLVPVVSRAATHILLLQGMNPKPSQPSHMVSGRQPER